MRPWGCCCEAPAPALAEAGEDGTPPVPTAVPVAEEERTGLTLAPLALALAAGPLEGAAARYSFEWERAVRLAPEPEESEAAREGGKT